MRTMLIYVGVYAAVCGVYAGAELAHDKIVKLNRKRKLKKEEQKDLQKKAEANGWTIVECYYDIEETIEAV